MNAIKPSRTRVKPILLAIGIVMALMFGGGITQERQDNSPNTISLQRPPFIGVTNAAGEQAPTSTIGTFLDSEAGISAYFQADGLINLNNIRSLYQTIEVETADYIIGSISVPNYSTESEQAHVYINKNGWVLAYYSKGDPTSKIIDLSVFQNNGTITTKLRNVAATVAQASGSSFSDVAYYHFQYPNATKILVVAEVNDSDGNNFSITLPSSYGYYERSWAIRGSTGPEFRLDGTTIGSCGYGGCLGNYGGITADQLLPDVPHIVSIHAAS